MVMWGCLTGARLVHASQHLGCVSQHWLDVTGCWFSTYGFSHCKCSSVRTAMVDQQSLLQHTGSVTGYSGMFCKVDMLKLNKRMNVDIALRLFVWLHLHRTHGCSPCSSCTAKLIRHMVSGYNLACDVYILMASRSASCHQASAADSTRFCCR